MKKSVFSFTSAFALLALAATPVMAQGDPDRGQSRARACVGCHAPDGSGNPAAGFPRLAGLNEAYLAKQMHDYKDGTRANAMMRNVVRNMDDQTIQDVAAYYAALSVPEIRVRDYDEATLALGKQLAYQGDHEKRIPSCASCHGPQNTGDGEHFPAIAGQHANYLVNELKAWQAGTRANDPIGIMGMIAGRMSVEQIEAVSAYLSTQPGTTD